MNKYKILVTDPLSDSGIDILQESDQFEVDVCIGLNEIELIRKIKDRDGLLIRSGTQVTEKVIEAANKLQIIGRAGVGVDNIDLAAASRKGVIVMNAPSGNTLATTELTVGMILSLNRMIHKAHRSMVEGQWLRKKLTGSELYNKTIGIIGLGRIGTEVAKRLKAFETKVIAYDPFATQEHIEQKGAIYCENLDQLYAQADIITVHIPSNSNTKGLIDSQAIAKMKPGVQLINCARGGIFVEKDLIKGLESGHIGGVALDVYEKEPPQEAHPLTQFDNVLLTPHIGAATVEAQENVSLDVTRQLRDFFLEGSIRNAVNLRSLPQNKDIKSFAYLELVHKIGQFCSKFWTKPLSHTIINTHHNIKKLQDNLISSFFQGYYSSLLDNQTINLINAPYCAKDRGVLTETITRNSDSIDYTVRIEVIYSDDFKLKIIGEVISPDHIRIVSVNEIPFDCVPSGDVLICCHIDQPGCVGTIGTILGKYNINIAHLKVGRKNIGKNAMTVINTDSPISLEIQKELEEISKIERVIFLTFNEKTCFNQ